MNVTAEEGNRCSCNEVLPSMIKDCQDNLNVRIDSVNDEVKKLLRRIEGMQRTLDFIYDDRNILEDIQTSITSLREGIHTNREHQERVSKDVKAEVIERGNEVREHVEQIEKKVDTKVEQVTNEVRDNLSELVQAIEKRKVVPVRESIIKRLNKFIRKRGEKK